MSIQKQENQFRTADFIRDAQREVLQQLDFLKGIIEKCSEKEIFKETESKKWQKELAEEKHKVERFELTLAFVGIMNSGKSTIINAIVGQDILPHRSTPMTSIPTVITHHPKQDIPIMNFSYPAPFNKAIEEIKQILNTTGIQNKQSMGDSEIAITIQAIKEGFLQEFKKKYNGTAEIFKFIKYMNDIVRICSDFDIPTPLNNYSKLEQLPIIEVEFECLTERNIRATGRLSLIDTPGPNEATSTNLAEVVLNQLRMASVVVGVLDYTALKGKDDQEVREWINDVKKSVGNDLFILINKFDQYNKKSVDQKNIIDYVKNLFNAEVATSMQDKIYPISAKYGFLSNLALRFIKKTSKLPTLENQDWLEDYARIAYGEADWEEAILDQDLDRHINASIKVWNKSLLKDPLEHVIAKSLDNAVPQCLLMALSRVKAMAEYLKKNLTLTNESTKKELKELEKILRQLARKLEIVNNLNQMANSLHQDASTRIRKVLEKSLQKIERIQAANITEKYLKNMKEEIFKENQLKRERIELSLSAQSWLINVLSKFILKHLAFNDEPIKIKQLVQFFKGEPLEFETKSEANEFLESIINSIGESVNNVFDNTIQIISSDINTEQITLKNEIVQKVSPIIEQIKDLIKTEFSLDIEFREPEFPELKIDMGRISKTNIIPKDVTKPVVEFEKRWYTLFLYNHPVERMVNSSVFMLDSNKIKKEFEAELETAKELLIDSVHEYVSQGFEERIKHFFEIINSEIGGIQNSITLGYETRNMSKEKQVEFIKWLNQILLEIEQLMKQNKSVLGGFHGIFNRSY